MGLMFCFTSEAQKYVSKYVKRS